MATNLSESSPSLSHESSFSARSESGISHSLNESSSNCSCAILCTLLSYTFCLKHMSLDTRLKVLWFWLFVLPITLGLILRFYKYASHTVTLSSHDLVKAQKISTTFCKGVTLKSSSYNVKILAYVLPDEPRMNSTPTAYKISWGAHLYPRKNKTFHYYLLAGSSVNLTACTSTFLYVYTIKSAENMERFLATRKSLYRNSSFSLKYDECRSRLFRISESDDYYFILGGDLVFSDTFLNLTLKRTLYEVNRKQVRRFQKTWEVYVPLDFHTTQNVVYGLNSEEFLEVAVTTHCVPRNPVYIGFFLILPLVLGLLVSCIFRQASQNNLDVSRSSFSSHRHDSITSMDMEYNRAIPEQPVLFPETLRSSVLPPIAENSLEDDWSTNEDLENRNRRDLTAPPPSYESLFTDNMNNELPSYQAVMALYNT